MTDFEVAEKLGISRSTVWRWARCGHLPSSLKLGPNTSRFDSHSIDRFIESRLLCDGVEGQSQRSSLGELDADKDNWGGSNG